MEEKNTKKGTTKKTTSAKKEPAKKTVAKAKKEPAKKVAIKKEEPKKTSAKVESKKEEPKKLETKKMETKVESKKIEKKPLNKKKNGNFTKTLLSIIIIAILVVTFAYIAMIQNEKSKVTSKITTAFESIKNGDETAKESYLGYDNIIKNKSSADFNVLFSKLDYKVENVSISNDLKSATAEVTVSNKDIGTIFANYIAKMLQLSFTSVFTGANESELNNQSTEYLTSQINSDNIETKTTNLNLNLTKDGDEWTITNDKTEIVDAILPGLVDKINSMKSSLTGLQK